MAEESAAATGPISTAIPATSHGRIFTRPVCADARGAARPGCAAIMSQRASEHSGRPVQSSLLRWTRVSTCRFPGNTRSARAVPEKVERVVPNALRPSRPEAVRCGHPFHLIPLGRAALTVTES
jgi:hypothetical protein